ncbi:hypothetical protein RDI58_019776 [Solanum bulbocastanum]|uniref:Uncharacterized protein n=1 Tax=Solanum bulbocastanum TaxID=147425 RepID=A0AAN8T7D1_SOLBU
MDQGKVENGSMKAVFIFVDSIDDQGNKNNITTLVKCNFEPYGKDFMGGKPTGKLTNAKTPSDLLGEEEANDILRNSLFLVVAGSDDLANTYFTIGIRRLHYDINAYTHLMVSATSHFVQRTLAGGFSRGCVVEYNQAAQLANTKLSAAIASSSTNLLQSLLVLIDIYNPLLDLIVNPQKHGFEVVDKGCCGSGMIEAVILCSKHSGTCDNNTIFILG